MQNRHTWLGLLVLALGASLGCEGGTEAELGSHEQGLGITRPPTGIGIGSGTANQPPILWPPTAPISVVGVSPGFTPDQVIGLVPAAGNCPEPKEDSGWKGGDMFPGASVPPESPRDAKFCSYTRVKPDATVKSLPRYCPNAASAAPCTGAAPEAWLEPTPRGIVRLAGFDGAARVQIAAAMRQHFTQLIDAPVRMPQTGGFAIPKGGPLPAQRTVWMLDDDGEHSKAVGQTIEAAACPGGACAVQVKHSNVFGASSASASAVTVSQALFGAVREAVKAGLSGVVFNASFGIHPALMAEPLPPPSESTSPSSTPTEPRPYLAYEALKAAINYAACNDYVVVAAAGNRDGGKDEDQSAPENPMYPGGWGDEKRAWSCGTKPIDDRPLVVAAGAITGDGRDSLTTRVNGQAELVTPGYAVPLDASGGGRLYWEGSSFSAAATSGIIAAAWSYMPKAPAREVLALVHDNAAPIVPQRFTQLCETGESCPVRRLSLCSTVHAALSRTAKVTGDLMIGNMRDTLQCAAQPSQSPFTPVTLGQDVLDQLDDTLGFHAWTPVSANPSEERCGGDALAPMNQAPLPYSCPFRELDSGQQERGQLERTPLGGSCRICTVVIREDGTTFAGRLDVIDLPVVVSSPVLNVRHLTRLPVSGGIAKQQESDEASSRRYYELGELLRSDLDLVVPLEEQVTADTRSLEVMLEVMVEDEHGNRHAQGIPIPVIDLRSP